MQAFGMAAAAKERKFRETLKMREGPSPNVDNGFVDSISLLWDGVGSILRGTTSEPSAQSEGDDQVRAVAKSSERSDDAGLPGMDQEPAVFSGHGDRILPVIRVGAKPKGGGSVIKIPRSIATFCFTSTSEEDALPPKAFTRNFLPEVVKAGLCRGFEPHLVIHGSAFDGNTLAAHVTLPNIPQGHPTVLLRARIHWLREDPLLESIKPFREGILRQIERKQKGGYEIPGHDPEVDPSRFVDSWEEIHEAMDLKEYKITNKDIGRRLRVLVEPVASDGQVGSMLQATTAEVLCSLPHVRKVRVTTCYGPMLQTVSSLRKGGIEAAAAMPIHEGGCLVGHPKPGMRLELSFEYVGGEPGDLQITWISLGSKARVWGDGRKERILATQTSEYLVMGTDLGRHIVVEILPVRADGVEGDRHLIYTRPVSEACCYSGRDHKHVFGVCPWEIHYADLHKRQGGVFFNVRGKQL